MQTSRAFSMGMQDHKKRFLPMKGPAGLRSYELRLLVAAAN